MENPTRTSELETHQVEDGFIIYDPSSAQVHHLNNVAFFIYSLCDGSCPAEDIVRLVATAYALDAEPATEVDIALDALRQKGLIAG